MGTTTTENTAKETKEMIIAKDVPKEMLDKILRYHVWGAMGVGLIPVPLVDLVGLTGVQLNMLRKLAKEYGIPFTKGPVKNVLSALVGGSMPVAVAPGVAASLAKFIPIFGQAAGVVTMPIIAGATTYAVGKVFIQHFASGGTFLTFNPKDVKDYYKKMFEEGKEVAAEMQAEQKS